MKLLALILISILYLITLTFFNFSLYKLLTSNNFGHQYYLILIYFLCELFSFFNYLIYKNKRIIIGDINTYIVSADMNTSSSISDIINNNISYIENNSIISNIRKTSENSIMSLTSNNFSSNYSIDSNTSKLPFLGIKCFSFIFSSFLDFLSKIFIYNGIKYMYQDSIFRNLIEILVVSFGSIIIFRLNKCCYSIIGLSIIFLYLFLFIISHKLKANMVGILLLLDGGFINSIQYLIQSKFFIKGEQFIYRIVSWEGLFGSIFSILILIIVSFVSCPFEKKEIRNNINIVNDNYFDYNSFCNGNKIEENFLTFFSEIKNNIGWFILYFISCLFYSFIGLFIIKYINVVYRVSLDTFRMLFFLIVFLILKK